MESSQEARNSSNKQDSIKGFAFERELTKLRRMKMAQVRMWNLMMKLAMCFNISEKKEQEKTAKNQDTSLSSAQKVWMI